MIIGKPKVMLAKFRSSYVAAISNAIKNFDQSQRGKLEMQTDYC